MGKKIMSIRLSIAALRMLPHIAFYLKNKQYFDKDLEKYSQGRGENDLLPLWIIRVFTATDYITDWDDTKVGLLSGCYLKIIRCIFQLHI